MLYLKVHNIWGSSIIIKEAVGGWGIEGKVYNLLFGGEEKVIIVNCGS